MQKWVAGEVLPTVRKTGGAYQNLTAPVSEIYLAIFTPPPMSSGIFRLIPILHPGPRFEC